MATNLLVTGSHGGDDPHVESKHDALMHAAMLGRGGYILKTRNWTMKPTAKDANNITIPAWDLVVEGRQIYIAAPTDVNIQSGSQGQKRRDLIVARYALNSGTGVETVTLEAIKGKSSAATPADPGIETGSIIGGAIVSDLPLCRVNLDGITITSIDTLVNVMQPLEDVWDSLAQRSTGWRVPYSRDSVLLTRIGNICFMGGNVKFDQSGETITRRLRRRFPKGIDLFPSIRPWPFSVVTRHSSVTARPMAPSRCSVTRTARTRDAPASGAPPTRCLRSFP